MMSRLYTIDEAAKQLRVSRAMLYRLIARGELHAIRIGRARRIVDADLEAFVTRLRRQAAPIGEEADNL